MEFEWDDSKNTINQIKHGIRFDEAQLIFNSPVLTTTDIRHDYGEQREISIGALNMEVVIALIHTDRMGENELFPLEKRIEKNEECTMNISKERLSEIAAIKESDIDYSDIPELDDTFWANAELKMPQTKDKITVRIDHDIVEWLKSQGTGYQSKMNSILRQFMLAKQHQK